MGTPFHGPSPWSHITRAIGTRGARCAAIAYLGQDAPDLLPLRAGDVLGVNASKAAVRAHATSPAAIAYYLDKGVRVLSSPTLHAKVIATNLRAVVGSAMPQRTPPSLTMPSSSDDPEVVASVRKFIDGIDEITEVDQVFSAVLPTHPRRPAPAPPLRCRGGTRRPRASWPVTADRHYVRSPTLRAALLALGTSDVNAFERSQKVWITGISTLWLGHRPGAARVGRSCRGRLPDRGTCLLTSDQRRGHLSRSSGSTSSSSGDRPVLPVGRRRCANPALEDRACALRSAVKPLTTEHS